MADKGTALPTSIQDNDYGYYATVNSDNYLNTASRIWDGTNYVTVTGNKLDVNATLSVGASKNYWQTQVEAGKGFTLTTNQISISGTSETAFLLVKNASGSGKNLRIHKIKFNIGRTVTGDNAWVSIYRNPTITSNGTTLTAVKIISTQATSNSSTYYSAPTISSYGTLLFNVNFEAGTETLYEETCFYVLPNENILFTIKPANTGKKYAINVWFTEE